MQVFISWSGDYSRQLAEEVRKWLPGALQFVRPYFTPDDIEKGARWSSDIAKKLDDSQVGIFCVTRENLASSWMLFEAGALSKHVEKSRICPILFGVDNADINGPLTQFQNTRFIKSDFKKLFETINGASDSSKLSKDVLDSVFEMWWPKLEDAISKIQIPQKNGQNDEVRSDREILEEVLALSRLNIEKIRRSPGRRASKSMRDVVRNFIALWLKSTSRSQPAYVIEIMNDCRKSLILLCRDYDEIRHVDDLRNLPDLMDEGIPF